MSHAIFQQSRISLRWKTHTGFLALLGQHSNLGAGAGSTMDRPSSRRKWVPGYPSSKKKGKVPEIRMKENALTACVKRVIKGRFLKRFKSFPNVPIKIFWIKYYKASLMLLIDTGGGGIPAQRPEIFLSDKSTKSTKLNMWVLNQQTACSDLSHKFNRQDQVSYYLSIISSHLHCNAGRTFKRIIVIIPFEKHFWTLTSNIEMLNPNYVVWLGS